MRRGFLGGTFDPIHHGHLDVASAAQRALELDLIEFLPAGTPPHRRAPVAPLPDRLAMVQLAVAGRAGWALSDLDAREPGRPAYTSETLDRLAASGLDTRTLFFVTGADAFRDIATWKEYPGLLERCHFVAVSRPGCAATALPGLLPPLAGRMLETPCRIPGRPSIFLVDAATAPVSSTDVRRRLAAGESIDGLVPAGVARYISTHGLYA
jgi:nicotinate-nucleotide adenylyltransferase